MERIDLNKKTAQWGLLVLLAFIWGASFILMKKGLESFSNYQVAAFRLFFSFIFLIPWIAKHLKQLSSQNIKSLLVVGIIGTGIPAFLFTTAQTRIDSSLAGMLNSMTPLFTLLIGLLLYKQISKWSNIMGIFIGLIGAIGLITNGNILNHVAINWYALFAVLATICYGISVNEVKYKLKELNAIQITSLVYVLIGPAAGIYLLFSGFSPVTFSSHSLLNLGYIAILALFGSVIAIVGFNALIKYTTAIFAASVTYIIPVFAIFWGIFDGEKLFLHQFAFIAVILIGVYLVNRE